MQYFVRSGKRQFDRRRFSLNPNMRRSTADFRQKSYFRRMSEAARRITRGR